MITDKQIFDEWKISQKINRVINKETEKQILKELKEQKQAKETASILSFSDTRSEFEKLSALQKIAYDIEADRKNIEAEAKAEVEYKKKEKALYAAKKRRWLKELEKSKK